jgi:acyl carrier protein
MVTSVDAVGVKILLGRRIFSNMLDGVSLEARVSGLIHEILAEHSIKRSISADDNLRDAGLTSIDLVNLVLSVEGEFNVSIPESEIKPANFRSIRAICTMITLLLN